MGKDAVQPKDKSEFFLPPPRLQTQLWLLPQYLEVKGCFLLSASNHFLSASYSEQDRALSSCPSKCKKNQSVNSSLCHQFDYEDAQSTQQGQEWAKLQRYKRAQYK